MFLFLESLMTLFSTRVCRLVSLVNRIAAGQSNLDVLGMGSGEGEFRFVEDKTEKLAWLPSSEACHALTSLNLLRQLLLLGIY